MRLFTHTHTLSGFKYTLAANNKVITQKFTVIHNFYTKQALHNNPIYVQATADYSISDVFTEFQLAKKNLFQFSQESNDEHSVRMVSYKVSTKMSYNKILL